MYHRVSEKTAGVAAPTWNVTPRRFRQQLAGLLARGYHPCRPPGAGVSPFRRAVSAADLRGYLLLRLRMRLRQAWPILKELAVPATIFLPTAYLDSKEPLPFDDWPGAGCSRADAAAWRRQFVAVPVPRLSSSGVAPQKGRTKSADACRSIQLRSGTDPVSVTVKG